MLHLEQFVEISGIVNNRIDVKTPIRGIENGTSFSVIQLCPDCLAEIFRQNEKRMIPQFPLCPLRHLLPDANDFCPCYKFASMISRIGQCP